MRWRRRAKRRAPEWSFSRPSRRLGSTPWPGLSSSPWPTGSRAPLLMARGTHPYENILIPIFFIHVGMQFDLGKVLSPERVLFTLALFGFAVAVKMIPALLFLFLGTGLRKALNAGILLSSRLSLIIVAASIGLEAGFISVEFKDAIVLLAVLTCLSGPTGFKLLHRTDAKPGKTGKRPNGGPWVGWMRE